MESQLLGFFQDRMATAYEEQTWAVALVSGMNAFIASNAELIRKGFKRWVLVSGITTISLLATAFVWSRHCIFVRLSAYSAAL
jgi:acetylglutamate kinase